MMKLTMRMNHTQHHTAVEQNRISGSTQIRYHTYCMVGWGGGGELWFTEVSRLGTRGMMVRDKRREQEMLAHLGSSKPDPASCEGGTFKLAVFFLHQDTYKHEHWPQKSASLSSLFPLTNGKHRLTARPKKQQQKKWAGSRREQRPTGDLAESGCHQDWEGHKRKLSFIWSHRQWSHALRHVILPGKPWWTADQPCWGGAELRLTQTKNQTTTSSQYLG